jgi:hypothetical protein
MDYAASTMDRFNVSDQRVNYGVACADTSNS